MRGLVLTTVTALGIGLLGLSGASAVPANGIAVSQATAAEQSIQPHGGVITIVGAGTAGTACGAGNRATLLAAPWPVTPSSHREPRHGH